ncbi:MAG: UTRA domain-containing protein [Janthinobacterium lividum]
MRLRSASCSAVGIPFFQEREEVNCGPVEQRFARTVREVRQEIMAIGVPAHLAHPLATTAQTHARAIARHYVDQHGLVFEVTISVFPADRFTYALQLRRR